MKETDNENKLRIAVGKYTRYALVSPVRQSDKGCGVIHSGGAGRGEEGQGDEGTEEG